MSLALQKLTDLIIDTEQKHPDSVLIILKDFNKANLSRELPKYRQHVTYPTRDSNILDHSYTTIKDGFHSVPWAALGLSDLFHLIPTYRQKLKSAKPVLWTVKRWTTETEQVLQAYFDLTDWIVFEDAATNLDELTETATSYISFCEDILETSRQVCWSWLELESARCWHSWSRIGHPCLKSWLKDLSRSPYFPIKHVRQQKIYSAQLVWTTSMLLFVTFRTSQGTSRKKAL